MMAMFSGELKLPAKRNTFFEFGLVVLFFRIHRVDWSHELVWIALREPLVE